LLCPTAIVPAAPTKNNKAAFSLAARQTRDMKIKPFAYLLAAGRLFLLHHNFSWLMAGGAH
jgi:hypothetical protein